MIARFVLAVAVLASCVRTAYADTEAAARKHAAKATKLAAKNKCRLAVREFTRAYEVLKDPTLLFNRAECERKLDKKYEALRDYEQFLADMPDAPNRASIEARIAELGGTSSASQPPNAPAPTAAHPDPVPDAGSESERPASLRRAEKWTD